MHHTSNRSKRKSKLLDQVREVIRLKHYSYSTEKAYVYHIYRYIIFHNKRHPRDMREKEIREFLTHLAVDKNVAASTQNQVLNAIVFLYKQVLKIELGDFSKHVRAKKSIIVPTVLSKNETDQFIRNAKPGVYKLMIQMLYGCGLRLSELFNLRIHDIDFDQQQITIRNAKGQKDRTVMLPLSILNVKFCRQGRRF